MDYSEMKDIASENDLRFVETTTSLTGYPQNVKGAIIGFKDYEQAEALSKKTGLNLEVITKHAGWQLWHRNRNWVSGPLEITEESFGDNFRFITSDDEKEFYENEVKPMLEDFDNLEDLMKFLEKKKEIAENLGSICDDYVVVTECGEYYNTINTRPMDFEYDSKYWAIALMQ